MNASGFFPHGYCLQWNPPLITLYVVTDAIIALSYYSIPAALFLLAYRSREGLRVQPLLILFGMFIAFCGGGHAIDIASLWTPVYWLKGVWNAGTAVASIATAIVLVPRVMEFVRMPEAAEKLRQEKTELLEQQSLVRAVLDSTLEGIVLQDETGQTILYNSAAQRILSSDGVPRVDWSGHHGSDEDVVRLANGRLVERSTRKVPGYGQLFVMRDITERHAAEEERLRLERVIQTMKQGFAIIAAPAGIIMSTNPSFDALYRSAPGELIGKPFVSLLQGEQTNREKAHHAIREHVVREAYWDGDITARRVDGTDFIAQSRFNVHSGGDQTLFSLIQVDVTDQRRLETESREFQEKMIETARLESVGLLAGGVAHDFNNLLTGILGNGTLVFDRISPSSPLREPISDLITATERAADLTRQLLAYSGKGRFVMGVLSIDDLLRETSDLVRMSIPRTVELQVLPGTRSLTVEADRTQMQQLFMNLIINGAEAIGEGRPGTVSVRTRAETIPAPVDGIAAGTYAVIEVEDNGSGMDEATLKRIFEPFFTTKFTGRGLGLAAALGIVNGHHGTLRVQSKPGLGTLFRVLLPASDAALPEPPPVSAATITAPLAVQNEPCTVLVIDDEQPVRSAARNALKFHGYEVLDAADGNRGLEIFRERASEIAVVLLDMTMPLMDGKEALRQIYAVRADARVILSSGFNEAEAIGKFAGLRLTGFLQKPYTAAELEQKIRIAMEG